MIDKEVENIFMPGSEWLYYKLYCGEKTADDILLDVIRPLVTNLLDKQIIDKWFFIRYSDPEPHLRIRFHLIDQKKIGKLMIRIKEQFLPLLNSNQVWNIQLATYKRELNRYGASTIEIAESYFFYDSQEAIKTIEQSENNEKKRFLLAFMLIENCINSFIPDKEKAIVFLNDRQLSFKKEFKIDSKSKKKLAQKYRVFIEEIKIYKIDKKEVSLSTFKLNCFNNYISLQKNEKKEINIVSVLASFIHMTINRNFMSKQRLYEMIIYDFLYKIYKSRYVYN